jgi:peptidoglycan hydrolase CwlO-like protein
MPRIEDAIRRMRAVVEVLDRDLAQYQTLVATPIPAAALSDAQWERAEAARSAVVQNLRELEQTAAAAATQANNWQAKAEQAARLGQPLLAEQAHLRAEEADAEQRVYAQEVAAVRVFLDEWAVRVTRA